MHAHLQCAKILTLAIRAKSVHKNKIISKTSHSKNKVHTPLHVKYDVFKIPDNHLLLLILHAFRVHKVLK